MLKDECMKFYFEGNYNCSECIMRAANDYYQLGLDEKALRSYGGFGAGMQCGNVCGTIASGVAILSLMFIETKAHESADIRPVCTDFIRRVNVRYGSTLCKDIKPQSFKPEYRCQKTVETVCDILEETIRDYRERTAGVL